MVCLHAQVQRLHADLAAELSQWHGTAAQLEAQLNQQGTQLADALSQAQQVCCQGFGRSKGVTAK